jgi:hypothetical protein
MPQNLLLLLGSPVARFDECFGLFSRTEARYSLSGQDKVDSVSTPMTDEPLTEEQIRSIEREIDREFLNTLRLGGEWKGVLREAALEITEDILTGHGTIDEASSASLMTYSLNVVNGCSVLLRHIEKVGSETRTTPPDDLEEKMKRAIAASGLYSTVEDAYVSYSHGYASARLVGEKTIRFDPPGGELDARLRYFGSISSPSDRLDNTMLPPLKLPDIMKEEHGERLVKTLMAGRLEQVGGFTYEMDKSLLQDFAEGYRAYFAQRIEMPMSTALGNMTLDGIVRAYSLICAAGRLHKYVSLLSKPSGFAKSINWPCLGRTEADWKKMLGLFCPPDQIDALVDLFRFDPNRPDADITLTPLVELGSGYLAISPTAVLRSNFFRNVFVLLIRRFPKEYSTYTSGREKMLAASARKILGTTWVGDGIRLPQWKGKQLPDIDLLIGSSDRATLVVCEIKWQLSGSSTREVINRDEYLKKGLRQLEAIREFLTANPRFLLSRELLNRETQPSDFEFVLLCKGHMGSETIQAERILKCDYDVFLEAVQQQGVSRAIELARTHSYLPQLGTDFTLEPISVRFGKWRLNWWTLLPKNLPADDESEAVLDFYSDSAAFLL